MFNPPKMSTAMELYKYPDELIFSAKSREGMTEDTEGICTLLSDLFTKAVRQGWTCEQNRQQAMEAAFRTAVLIHNCADGPHQQLMAAILKECSGRYNPATAIPLVMANRLLAVQQNISEREKDIVGKIEQYLGGRQDATQKICRALSLPTKCKTARFHTALEVHPTPVEEMCAETLSWIDQRMEKDDLLYLLRHYPDTQQQLELYDRAMKHNLSLLTQMTDKATDGRNLTDLRQAIRNGEFLNTSSGTPAAATATPGDSGPAGGEETEVRRLNHRLAELSAALHEKDQETERWKSAFSSLYDQLVRKQEEMEALGKEKETLQKEKKVLQNETERLSREKTATEQRIAAFIDLLRRSTLPPDITSRLPAEVEKQLLALAERLDRLFRSRIVQVNNYDQQTAVYQGPTLVSAGQGTFNVYPDKPDKPDGQAEGSTTCQADHPDNQRLNL